MSFCLIFLFGRCNIFGRDHIDFISDYDILKNKSCYNSKELLTIYNKYKFVICFENSKTNGYVTEKIFNAFLAGAVPIYDGAPNIDEYVLKNSYIPYNDDTLNKMLYLSKNENMYNAVINYPKTTNLDYTQIDDIISQVFPNTKMN